MGTLTEDEHIARAMLLGMHYHAGNGEPFYYKKDAGGTSDPTSFVDANTLETMVDSNQTVHWKGYSRRAKAMRLLETEEKVSWLK